MKKFLKPLLIILSIFLALGFITKNCNCRDSQQQEQNIIVEENSIKFNAEAETQELPENLSGGTIDTAQNKITFPAGSYIFKKELSTYPNSNAENYNYNNYAVFKDEVKYGTTFNLSPSGVYSSGSTLYEKQTNSLVYKFKDTRMLFFPSQFTLSNKGYGLWFYNNIINLKYYDELIEDSKEQGYTEGFTEGVEEGKHQDDNYIQGYEEGYTKGKEEGYTEGQTEGAEQAQYGIFQNATIDAEFTFLSDSSTNEITKTENNLVPLYVSNGINTNNIWKQYETITQNGESYTIEQADITINLSNPILYSNERAILISGNVSLVNSITFTDIKGRKFSAEFQYNTGDFYYSKLSDQDLKQIDLVKSMSLHFGRAVDTFANVTITQDNGNYTGGFTSGYNEGLSDGRLEGYEEGYSIGKDIGYTEGEAQGYTNALSEGINQQGIFYSAVAFTKLFFQLCTQFLSTKIAGDISLGLLVIGLPCAFMIINLGIGLIKKWLGGRGANEE